MQTFDEVLKKKLLDTFKYTIEFLEKNSISWFVGGGACLGTVRQKGMIPWDDDIDIYIPRKDFERFIQLNKEFLSEKYELKHQSLDPNFGTRFAKVLDRTTTIYPSPIYPFVIGVFVDIFPLDSSDEDKDTITRHINGLNKLWSNYFSSFIHYPFKSIIKGLSDPVSVARMIRTNICNHNGKPNNLLREKVLSVDKQYLNSNGGGYSFISYGRKGILDIFETSWFEGFVLKPFEDIYVKVPVGYDAYLTHVFGDYMTPPPENKRVYKHPMYYVNLKEKLDLKEIKRRIKSGERKVF